MNTIDLVFILILGWAAWKGFSRGFIIEVASLAALILGVYLAVKFSWIAADIIQQYVDLAGNTLHFISFCITFVCVVLLVMLIGKLLERLINLVMLGWANRLGGAVFSVAKILVIISVLIMIMNTVDRTGRVLKDRHKDESAFYRPVESLGYSLLKILHLGSLIPFENEWRDNLPLDGEKEPDRLI